LDLFDEQLNARISTLGNSDERVEASSVLNEESWHTESSIGIDGEEMRLKSGRVDESESGSWSASLSQESGQLAASLSRDQVQELDVSVDVLHEGQVDQVNLDLWQLAQSRLELAANSSIDSQRTLNRAVAGSNHALDWGWLNWGKWSDFTLLASKKTQHSDSSESESPQEWKAHAETETETETTEPGKHWRHNCWRDWRDHTGRW